MARNNLNYSDVISLTSESKWAWNAQGELVETPAGQPAYDHDPVTGEPLGQRIESVEATTIWRFPTELSGVGGYQPASGLDPRGAPAYKVTIGEGDGSFVQRAFSVVGNFSAGQPYTYSLFVKPEGASAVTFVSGNTNIINPLGLFDLSSMTAPAGGSIEPAGYGWFRISKTVQASRDDATIQYVRVVGSTGEAMQVFGGQIEQGTEATSYITNSGRAVTRAGDVVNANTSFAEQYDPAQGFLFISYDRQGTHPGMIFSAATFSNNADSIQIIDNQPRIVFGENVVIREFLSSIDGPHKVLFKWGNGVIKIFGDGALLNEAERPMPQAPTTCHFFRRADGAAPSNGHLFEFQMGDTITDSDAIARTTL